MVMQVPEFFNRAAQRRLKFVPVLIETHTDVGVEWGVSLTSSNPEAQDYHACRSKEEALNLMDMLREGSEPAAADKHSEAMTDS